MASKSNLKRKTTGDPKVIKATYDAIIIADYWEQWCNKNAEKRVGVMVRIPRPPPPEPEAAPDLPEEPVEMVGEPVLLDDEARDALLRDLREHHRERRAARQQQQLAERREERRRRRAAPRSVHVARGEELL